MKRYYIFVLFLFLACVSSCHHKDEIDVVIDEVIDNSIHFGDDYATVLEKLSLDFTTEESGGNIYCYGQDSYSVVAYDFENDNLYAVTYVIPQNNGSEESVVNQKLRGFKNLGLINSLDTYYNEKNQCFAVVKDISENDQAYTVIACTQYDPNNNDVIVPSIEIQAVNSDNSNAIIKVLITGVEGYADWYIYYSLNEDFSYPSVYHVNSTRGSFTVTLPVDWKKGKYFIRGYMIYEGVRYDTSNYWYISVD